MNILAIGIDETTVQFLRDKRNNVEEAVLDDFYLADWLTKDAPYEAAVINLDIGQGIGAYVCREVRERGVSQPVIGVQTPGSAWSDSRSLFLDNGGDDLIRAPCNPRELESSLRACLRRLRNAVVQPVVCVSKGEALLKVNPATGSVTVNGADLALSGKEYALLVALATANRVLSKDDLLSALYRTGVDDEPEVKIIDVFVCKLRKKLNDAHAGAGEMLATDWGRGYVLRGDEFRESQL